MEKRYSENTLTAYSKDLQQFSLFLLKQFDFMFKDVKHLHIRSFMVELMNDKISNRSVCRKLSALKSLYKFLIKKGEVEFSPLANIQLPKIQKKLPSFVKEKEILELNDRSIYSEDFFGLRDYVLVRLFYQTGMRLSELTGLKDADVSNDVIKVVGKRNKERMVPISSNLSTILILHQKNF